MTNLTKTNVGQNEPEIILTPFETDDGLSVKIDLSAQLVYATQRDLAEIVKIGRTALQNDLKPGQKLYEYLRTYDVSATPKQAKLSNGGLASAFDLQQIKYIAKFYDSDILENVEDFGLNAKLMAMVGYKAILISPDQQTVISQAEADIESIKRLMGGVINTALALPGYNALGNSIGWVEPKFNGKELTTRQWVETHFPDLLLFGTRDIMRIGRAFGNAVIQNHQNLATNSYTPTSNRYREEHHQVLCATFFNMRKLSLVQ